MSLTIGYLIATITAQAGSAYFNCRRSSKQAKRLAQKQQEYEEKLLREGIENSRKEFAEICALQREIEQKINLDRIQLIRDNHHTTLLLEAYRHSLKSWPLFVPPFIIKNKCLPLFEDDPKELIETIPVNCLLTPSTDNAFNSRCFHQLEERLAQFFSKYWASNSVKAVRFYQQGWRNNVTDVGSMIYDLKAHLAEVPNIILSPIIEDNKLKFTFSWWGFSTGTEDEHILENTYDPELSIPIKPGMVYPDDIVDKIINEVVEKLFALISYFADLYYWNFYNLVPTLPIMLHNNLIDITNVDEFIIGYMKTLESPLIKKDIDHSLEYAQSLLPIVQKNTLPIFKDALLKALCEYTLIKYDKSKSINDVILKDDLFLRLSLEQIENINDLFEKCESIDNKNVSFEELSIQYDSPISKSTLDHNAYFLKKEELLGLLKDICQVRKLPKEHRLNFDRIMRKIQEDQFSIALIGEFQGGKSTTFDALCGGREISPRGNNIKTSSCRIVAKNIVSDEQEHAIVHWKSNIEIIQTISSILGSIDPESLGFDESSKAIFSYAEYVDLDNPKHIDLIKSAIEIEDNSSFNVEDNKKDVILIARFIISFFERTKKMRQQKEFSIGEASKIMTFPQRMMERYNEANGDVSSFTPEEALFAFVQTVDCYIHSKNLERLGCAVIDCPGLFASDYDTSIALDTIINSDAVLYLLNGEKQYSQGDEKAIGTIWNLGKLAQPDFDGDNVFFAINQRKPIEQTSFVSLDLSMINQIGFSKNYLPIYNALLYYYAQLGKSYLLGQLDDKTKQDFLNNSKKQYNSFEQKWVKDISKIFLSLDIDEEYDIDSLNQENVGIVCAVSDSITVFSSIEDYIVQQKASSILIDNGAVKILKGLIAVESILLQQESSARKDVAERAKEYETARSELNNFLAKSEIIIDKSFNNDVLSQFVDNVYSHYFIKDDVVQTISLEITKSLLTFVRQSSTKWDAICSKIGFTKKIRNENTSKLRSDIEPFFTQSFTEAFSPIIEKWVKKMFADKDEDFKKVMLKEAKSLSDAIENEWQIAVSATPILQNLTPIESTLNLAECTKQNAKFSDKIGNDAIDKAAGMAIKDIIAEIISQVVSFVVGTAVSVALDAIFTAGIATIIGLISAVLTYLGLRKPKDIKSPDDLGKKGRQLYDMIHSNIFSALTNGNTKEQVCYSSQGLISIAKQLAQSFKDFYTHQLSSRSKELEEVISEKEIEYSGKRNDLERIAQEAEEIRTQDVEPLRKKVSQFIENAKHE